MKGRCCGRNNTSLVFRSQSDNLAPRCSHKLSDGTRASVRHTHSERTTRANEPPWTVSGERARKKRTAPLLAILSRAVRTLFGPKEGRHRNPRSSFLPNARVALQDRRPGHRLTRAVVFSFRAHPKGKRGASCTQESKRALHAALHDGLQPQGRLRDDMGGPPLELQGVLVLPPDERVLHGVLPALRPLREQRQDA